MYVLRISSCGGRVALHLSTKIEVQVQYPVEAAYDYPTCMILESTQIHRNGYQTIGWESKAVQSVEGHKSIQPHKLDTTQNASFSVNFLGEKGTGHPTSLFRGLENVKA